MGEITSYGVLGKFQILLLPVARRSMDGSVLKDCYFYPFVATSEFETQMGGINTL